MRPAAAAAAEHKGGRLARRTAAAGGRGTITNSWAPCACVCNPVALRLFLTTGNIRSAAHTDFNLSKVTEGAALNPSSTMGNVNPRWLVGWGCWQAPP